MESKARMKRNKIRTRYFDYDVFAYKVNEDIVALEIRFV